MTLKAQLRREIIARTLALDPETRRREESAILDQFNQLPDLSTSKTVLLYVSAFPEELETRPFLERVLARGQRLLCPRVRRKENRLSLHEVRSLDTDLVPGTLGILEPRADLPEVDPSEVDWALVPGIAFDPRGYRLGRGAGHYDRLLPRLRPDAPRWSALLSPQWVAELPVEPHDVPVDGILSHVGCAVTRSVHRT